MSIGYSAIRWVALALSASALLLLSGWCSAGEIQYQYDDAARLRRVIDTDNSQTSYKLDPAGNRVDVTRLNAPGAPASISVPFGSTTGSYTITWGAASGTVTGYELYEATNSGFSGQTVAYSGTGVSITLSGRGDGTYYYRVRACDVGVGLCGNYSTGGNAVSVTLPPGTPASISVPSSSLTGSYTISWGAASGTVTGYELYEATNSSFSGATLVYSGTAASTVLSGRADGTYYYRVRGCNVGACSGYRAGGNAIAVTIPPSVPASISVPSSSTTGSFTISWGASTGPLNAYQLYEATDSGFSGAVLVYSGAGTSVPLTRTKGTYYYRVRGCSLSACSNYRTGGNPIAVTATPGQPTSISFPSTNSTGSYTVSWGASTGTITAYELYEALGITGTGAVLIYNGTGTSAGISGKTDGEFWYRVRACNTSIDCSVYQTGGTGVTVRIAPSAPSSISVPSTSSTGSYQINFGAATGTVTHFELYEATNPSFSGEVSVPASLTHASIVGKNNGTYYYRVRACNTVDSCSSGYAPGPNVITVTLPPAQPTTPLNLRKSPSTGTGNIYTILWDPSGGPVSYYILEESSSGGAFIPFPQINHPTTSKSFNQGCGEYTYRVKACSAGGTCSSYSNQTTKRVCNN